MISETTKNRIKKNLPIRYVSEVQKLLPQYSESYIREVKSGKRNNIEIWEALSIVSQENLKRVEKLENNG